MIHPMDLQTLYMNLEKVGKEQSQSRDHAINYQNSEILKLQKAHEADGTIVKKTTTGSQGDDESTKKTKMEDHELSGKSRNPSQDKKALKDDTEKEVKEKNDWKDPNLGQNIDISG